MSFVSANPSIVRSVLQRDLLNTWLRLFGRDSSLPAFHEYGFERIEDEQPDLVQYDIAHGEHGARFLVAHQGRRLAEAFGVIARGTDLEEALGPELARSIMPFYYECVLRCRPIYSVVRVPDADGRQVLYERLLLPFGTGLHVEFILGSIKTISEEGTFRLKDLMRAQKLKPAYAVQAVIDSDFAINRIAKQLDADVIEL